MRRTHVYLEDDLWAALQALSRKSGMSVSALVRQAVRERYKRFDDLPGSALLL